MNRHTYMWITKTVQKLKGKSRQLKQLVWQPHRENGSGSTAMFSHISLRMPCRGFLRRQYCLACGKPKSNCFNMRGTFEYSSQSLWKTGQNHWNLFGKLLGNGKLVITSWLSFCCQCSAHQTLQLPWKISKTNFETRKAYKCFPSPTAQWLSPYVLKYEGENQENLLLRERTAPNVASPKLEKDKILQWGMISYCDLQVPELQQGGIEAFLLESSQYIL